MKKDDAVVVAVKDVIARKPGVCINGIMKEIGTAHGGPGTYKDDKVFRGVQFLKAEGSIKEDDRGGKKNVPLYLKSAKLPKEPIKHESYRKPKAAAEPAAETSSTEPANA